MKSIVLLFLVFSVSGFRVYTLPDENDFHFFPVIKRSIRLPSAVQRKLYPSVVSATVPKRPTKTVAVLPRVLPPISEAQQNALDCLGMKIFAKMRSWGDTSSINC